MLERIPLPHRLSPRVWLLSIPMSLLSLERRQRLPKLSIGRWRWLGVPLLGAGLALWLWSYRALWERGQGTPNPDNPPRLLVEEGPYRYMRNPMAVAGLLDVAGAGLLLRSPLLLLYVPALAFVTHLYVVREEEQELRQRFGEQYEEYRRRIPRWLPLGRRPRAEKV